MVVEQLRLPSELIPKEIVARGEIARLKAAGYGPTAIARTLNSSGVSTPSGRGVWWATTVIRHGDPAAAARWRRYIADYRRQHR